MRDQQTDRDAGAIVQRCGLWKFNAIIELFATGTADRHTLGMAVAS
jgi:hypothetical protein